MELAYLLAGAVVAGLAVYFGLRGQLASLHARLAEAEARNAAAHADAAARSNDLVQARAAQAAAQAQAQAATEARQVQLAEVAALRSDKETLGAQLAREQEARRHLEHRLETQQQELAAQHEQLEVRFRHLAQNILETNSARFKEQNQEQIGALLNPLRERIVDFQKKVEEVYVTESKDRASLLQQVRQLQEQTNRVSAEAHNLATALKGNVKAQGNFGERILELLLERSGLARDREYVVQPSYTTPDGNRLQPDVVLYLPGERSIVIDSKCSLQAYERYYNADDDAVRELALKDHLGSVRKHVRDLGTKNYQNLYQLNTLDFVLLFMPIEPAYLSAVHADATLLTDAYDQRVLLSSPTHLLAMLRMIANLWRSELQNRNMLEIARQSGDLYDKFVGFADDLIAVGKSLDGAKRQYEGAMNKLVQGRGNLVSRAESLRKLGIKTEKQLNAQLVDRADDAPALPPAEPELEEDTDADLPATLPPATAPVSETPQPGNGLF